MDEIKIPEERTDGEEKRVLEIPNIKRKKENQSLNKDNEESKTEESSLSDEEYRKKQEEFRKKRKRRKKLNKIKNICYSFFFTIIFLGVLYILSLGYINLWKNIGELMTPREEKESSYGVYFERDLEKAFDDLKEEPEDRDFAWNSELPEFIEEDIVYLTDNQDYEFIKYVFGNSEFYIKLDYQEPKLSFSVDDAYYVEISGYNNFSIYKSENSIIIYAEDIEDRFIRYEIKKTGERSSEVKTENVAIAFSEKAKSVYEIKPSYYLCIGEDSRTIFIYHEKEVIGEKITLDSDTSIESYYLKYPMLYTQNEELYMPYIVNELEETSLKLVKVANVSQKEYNSLKYVTIQEDDFNAWELPVIQRDRDAIILMPKDPMNFRKYLKSNGVYTVNDEKNFEWKQVSMKDAFLKAEIDTVDDFGYDESDWNATIYLNIGNLIGTYEYDINGYDRYVKIPDTETGLSAGYTVLSEEEFWNVIDKIRNTYAKYYDYRSE